MDFTGYWKQSREFLEKFNLRFLEKMVGVFDVHGCLGCRYVEDVDWLCFLGWVSAHTYLFTNALIDIINFSSPYTSNELKAII